VVKKVFIISVNGCNKTVSVDRLKPAFLLAEDIEDRADPSPERDDRILVSFSGPPPVNSAGVPSEVSKDVAFRTRYGRRVRFPDRLQAGFS
jgi:hypothetical protein